WSAPPDLGPVVAMAHDAPRQRLITAGADGRIRIWDAALRARRVGGAPAGRLSMRGGRMLIRAGGGARLHDAGAAPVGPVFAAPEGAFATPLAGGLVAVAPAPGAGGDFILIDAATGAEIARHADLAAAPAISPGGARFLLIGADGGALWGDGAGGRVRARLRPGPGGRFLSGDAADSGFALIASDAEGGALLFAGDDDGALRPVAGWPRARAELRLSPDGGVALVRLVAESGAVSGLIVDLVTGARVPVAAEIAAEGRFGFSPDGGLVHLAAAQGGAVIAARHDGRVAMKTPPGDLIWSASGEVVALKAPPLRAFRAATGAPLCAGEKMAAAALGPDGDRAALRGDGGFRVIDLGLCAPLYSAQAALVGAPVFAGPDRLWLPLEDGLARLSLKVDFAAARAGLARIGDEGRGWWRSAGRDAIREP
ncbi:MAG: hypothetical protein ACK5MQ_11820, partial [Pikeienuella sp.]